ncbi:helix-turn-helix domain-containing protein [Adlercreutzia sp. R21]|uniref:helix-turn-helix domain-containing protein n=1 Tax=Adlercreutzia wanghongyangiae TaxID=3111451 RepID=UPI002DB78121|nr:helix-turn-helix domain-containing protein [Adlercreutzia sp. R21]MEC4184724.1 helix-turn-helix domain-containing protein [Adlercreutzia sp. R21]
MRSWTISCPTGSSAAQNCGRGVSAVCLKWVVGGCNGWLAILALRILLQEKGPCLGVRVFSASLLVSVFVSIRKILVLSLILLRIGMILCSERNCLPICKKWVVMDISRDQIMAQGLRVRECADLGAALRSRRKRFGYTQEELADMLGFSPRLVGEIERGRGTVGIDKVLSFASALGVDVVAFER